MHRSRDSRGDGGGKGTALSLCPGPVLVVPLRRRGEMLNLGAVPLCRGCSVVFGL